MRGVETRPPLGCAAVMLGVFRAVLQEHHLPLTQQREAIAQILFESGRHLSAEDIVETLRERGEGVGKATVYRTLNLLVQVGLALEHDFDEGFKRYEMSAGPSRHDHLICTSCGAVVEFQSSDLDTLQAAVADSHGFHILTRQVKLYGLCPVCEESADAELLTAR
ncbi:MAG: transcriptional repressor [Gemmatimonadota bacterium]|jgi:Fur family ferric uptake transcriptional regulator|nr:MAG: transcriptional repressor [Gemmatimonadota bacterium]